MSQKDLASTDIEEMKSWDQDQWFQYLCKDGLLDIDEVFSKFNEVLGLTENNNAPSLQSTITFVDDIDEFIEQNGLVPLSDFNKYINI